MEMRSFLLYSIHQVLLGDNIEEDVIGGANRTRRTGESCIAT